MHINKTIYIKRLSNMNKKVNIKRLQSIPMDNSKGEMV